MTVGTTDALTVLHEMYIEKINIAVAADRLDLATELAAQHTEDALSLLLTEGRSQAASA